MIVVKNHINSNIFSSIIQESKIKKELKLDNENIKKTKEEINSSFSSLFSGVDSLISDMKLHSSEEILNGSVQEAQKLLAQILPYQNFYEKLVEAKSVFDQLESVPKEAIEEAKKKIKSLNQEEIDEEVKESNEGKEQETDFTTQINFRIPILKALIFLGGSSEEVDVTEFVKKEMKKKLTDKDYEVPEGEDKERWLSNLYFETATMIDEGLLAKESSNKTWEIAQKGIDYLSKYAK
jgi:hypothetical protein